MSKKSYNYLALRGANVDDMEYVEEFGLPEDVAYTPLINDVMLKRVYDENIADGVSEEIATQNFNTAKRDIKELLAKNGMLK